jgi:hypothetical protein
MYYLVSLPKLQPDLPRHVDHGEPKDPGASRASITVRSSSSPIPEAEGCSLAFILACAEGGLRNLRYVPVQIHGPISTAWPPLGRPH